MRRRRQRRRLVAYAAACDAALEALPPAHRGRPIRDWISECATEARRLAATKATQEELAALVRSTPQPPWASQKGRDAAGVPSDVLDRADAHFAALRAAALALRGL